MYNLIDDSDVILFDVFDTAVLRKVNHPSEVFNLLGTGFKFKRTQAEFDAAVKKPHCTLEDIYAELGQPENSERERLFEIDLAYRNPEIYNYYKYALNQGKKVAFVSDMYLSPATISTILNNCGYEDEQLFVSCVEGASKYFGNMYEVIKDFYKVNPEKMLMIGDNKHGDYDMAIRQGLKAVHYERSQSDEDFWYRLGYNELGCITLAFVQWLRTSFRNQGVQKAYFFSREGLIFKHVYDLIREDWDAESEYLYVSRKTTHFAVIANHTPREFLDKPENEYLYWFVRNQLCKSGNDFFKYIGVDKTIDDGIDCTKLLPYQREQYNNRLLRENILEFSDSCIGMLFNISKYLSDKFDNYDKVAVIDLGWQGSVQKALQSLLKGMFEDMEVFGYYFATSSRADDNKKIINLEGFLDKDSICLNNIWLIENLFMCNQGSVVNYENGTPILDKERKPYTEWIHKGILDFVADYKHMRIDNTKNLGRLKFNRLLLNPTSKEAEMLGNILNYSGSDDFGIPIAKPDLASLKNQYQQCANKNIFLLRLLNMIFKEF